jgi:hypothetical protein
MSQPQLRLPASERDVMDADKYEILELDIVAPVADPPTWVAGVFVHGQAFGLLHETLHTFRNVFR